MSAGGAETTGTHIRRTANSGINVVIIQDINDDGLFGCTASEQKRR